MFSRSTIFLGLLLSGSLALASFAGEDVSADSEVAQPVVRTRTVDKSPSGMPALQLERLKRSVAVMPESNPFASKSWYVPPPLPPVIETLKEEVAQPVAPPLPFRYMGRIQEEGEQAVVFLIQGSTVRSVLVGDEIDGGYRLESITPSQLVFHYQPMDIRQTMILGNDLSLQDASVASAGEVRPDGVSTPISESGL